ncbi:MAG: ABC transporter substrate-binding protein [Thermorudis peleae]|nr:ABC transporter substrate-binding protein [Thermorudis peleae]
MTEWGEPGQDWIWVFLHQQLGRRAFLRRAAELGLSGPALLAVLAACAGETKTPTTGPGAGTPLVASPTSAGTSVATKQATPAGQPKQGGQIIIGTLGEAQTINPFVSNESEGNWRVKMLFDQFVRLKLDTLEPKPGLAKSWQRDNLTYTFQIQDNAKFSDGTDLTADDVAFTIKGILAKATASPRQSRFLSIQGAKAYAAGSADDVAGIKVLDPKRLQITLEQPDASFLINLRYVSPVPKRLLEGKDLSAKSQDPFFQKPIGAGPFKFVSWTVGGDFVAERNPYYYEQGLPYLDRFTHRVIADAQSLANALLSGDIDGSLYPTPATYQQLKNNANLTVIVPPFTQPDGWLFNLKHPYLSKKEVRQAVAYALDMNQFANDSLYGLGKPGRGPIAPSNWAFDDSIQPWPYDLDKAKQLLQQAGPPPSDIEFLANKGNIPREDFLTYTQQQLEKIGWKIKASVIEWTVLVTRTINKNFDVSQATFVGATIDPGDLAIQFMTNGSQNYASYSNPQLDTLLDQARKELDTQKAKDLYKQIQRILLDDLPAYWAWYRPFLHVIKKQFAGYVPTVETGGIFAELERVYVAK